MSLVNYSIFLKQVYFRKKFIKMDDLRNFFKNIGFKDSNTIYTTGNVIFSSEKLKNELYEIITKELKNYYLYDIDIFIKTDTDIKKILNSFPFELKKGFYNQVFLCENGFEKLLFDEFSKFHLLDNEKFTLINNILYWHYDKSIKFNSELLKILSKNSFKHNFTIRTIGMLQKIYEKISK